ncbi:MAG: hypothetical protein HY515_02540 [Candidatus Aenigmarchaeota archaeon]|nr:hypothetical protein [Candidatus Aenigmarchaeota archaeon]
MKTFFLALTIVCFVFSQAFAGEPTEQEAMAKALSHSIETFRKLSEPGSGYNVVLHRDPMEPLIDGQGNVVSSIGLHEGLVVQGIIYSEGFKSVLVDDQFYFQGDTVGSYHIVEVKPDGFVARQDDGKTIFVPLYSNTQAQEKPIAKSAG